MRTPITSLLFGFILLLSACDNKPDVVKRDGEPDYFRVNDHSAMDAAITRAKNEISTFREALADQAAEGSYFSIKKPFPYFKDGEEHQEHIWIQEVQLTEDGFAGFIGNAPVDTKEVSLGDSVTVKNDDISDWMIIRDGLLHGGYTIRVLRDSMSPEERKAFDESVSFKIE
jgi:uncharacterized protein YegJ (DUF2314 family)